MDYMGSIQWGMDFATLIMVLLAINALISAPLALIISAIIFAVKKSHNADEGFLAIFWPVIKIGSGTLTTAFFIYWVIMNLKSCL